MATSGSVDFSNNAAEIIEDAYSHLGVLESGETLTDTQLQYGLRKLNQMAKAWQMQDIHIWTLTEATLFLIKDQKSYTFPTAHATDSFVSTTISADEASGQTVLSVASSTGMSAADFAGVELDGGDLQWTTIASVDSPTQITVTDALTDDAASGNVVYAYTTKINRPLGLTEFRHVLNGGTEVPGWIVSRNEYQMLPTKTTAGKAIQVYYDRQRTTGILYVWPTADNVKDYIKFTYKRPIEDFDDSTNDPDFPVEWIECLGLNLAVRLAPKEQVPLALRQDLKIDAQMSLMAMTEADSEDVSIEFIYSDD